MPEFHFDVTDGEYYPDLAGLELKDIHAARLHAVEVATGLLSANAAKFWRGEKWLVEVRDDCGLVLLTLAFSARESPTIRSARPPSDLAA